MGIQCRNLPYRDELILSNAWISLGREDAVKRLTSEDKCILQMGIVCI